MELAKAKKRYYTHWVEMEKHINKKNIQTIDGIEYIPDSDIEEALEIVTTGKSLGNGWDI